MDKVTLDKKIYRHLLLANKTISETLEKYNISIDEESEKGDKISLSEANLIFGLIDDIIFNTSKAKDLIQAELIATTGKEFKQSEKEKGFFSPTTTL